MPKQSGLGDALYVGGYNLSGDIQSLSQISGRIETIDTTGIDKSAHERIGGLREGNFSFTSFFNPTAGQAHPVLSALPTADTILTYLRGTALGGPGACMVAKQVSYDPTRAAGGELTFNINAVSNAYGLEWGVSGTAGQRTDTTATNGTSIDLGTVVAAAGFGLQAYLQVFSVVGTSCTVKLQGSSDNAVGDPFADIVGGGFVAATPGGSPQTQRIATAANLTIERYLRVVTTGTFTSCVFNVVVVPNVVSTVF